MDFISTRNPEKKVTIVTAITNGLAPDGGLYVPCQFPKIALKTFLPINSYSTFTYEVIKPFFKNSVLEKKISSICDKAFTFEVPLRFIEKNTYLLELFHGPTLSFKDFGAQFLAGVLAELSINQPRTVLVATSGDTGSAVANGFHNKANIRVAVLFPLGKVTKRQQQQLTCWDNNIITVAIDGSFDDCQNLVKQAFQSPAWKAYHLTSANSINIGRLLPQMAYYAYASVMFYKQQQQPINFIVPSGNLGNVTAAYWAKNLGFPIEKIAIACNANRVLPDYLASGKFQPQPSKPTLANAMDVGNPSNFERLTFLFKSYADFKKNVHAISVSDNDILNTIKFVYQKHQLTICPHTATAYFMRQQLSHEESWTVIATADPCKFETVIEPLLHTALPIPKQLQWMLTQPPHFKKIEPVLDALKVTINQGGPSPQYL